MAASAVLFVAVLALLVAVVMCDPPRPEWPDQFSAFITDTLRSKGKENVTKGYLYYSLPLQMQRFDSTNKYGDSYEVLEDFQKGVQYYIPFNSSNICDKAPLQFPMRLPNFENFAYRGTSYLFGQEVYNWQMLVGPAQYDYYDNVQTRFPVEFIVQNPHMFFSTFYQTFVPFPVDPSLFRIPLQCTSA